MVSPVEADPAQPWADNGGKPSEALGAAPAVAAPSWWTPARGLAVCLLVGAAIRLMSTVTVPLIISNDGVGYLHWAEQLYTGEPLNILPHRTPGYPLFLAGVFHLFGISQAAVMISQHVLALAGTALVFGIACHLTRPSFAVIAALLYSLDPWLLSLETFALTETLTWFLILTAAGLVWYRRRGNLFWPLLLGVIVGFASLTRPTCELLIPFLLLARVAASWTHWRRGVLTVLAGAIGVGLVLAPWLQFNARRGIKGLASGSGAQIWIDLKILNLLGEPDFPLDEDVRATYARAGLDKPGWSEDQLFEFLYAVDAFKTRSQLLGRWARSSIRANPRDYLKAAGCAACWQLKWYPRGGRKQYDDLQFYLARVGETGGNFQFGGNPAGVERFAAQIRQTPFHTVLRACDKFKVPGFPAVPLFILAAVALAIRTAKRDWATVLVLLATMGFMLAHALLLSPMSRYTLVVWPIWYAAGTIVLDSAWRLAERTSRALHRARVA